MNTTAPSAPRWFDTEQAAEYLGITARKVARLRQSGKLGYIRLSHSSVRHSQAQLDAYIESVTVAPRIDAK